LSGDDIGNDIKELRGRKVIKHLAWGGAGPKTPRKKTTQEVPEQKERIKNGRKEEKISLKIDYLYHSVKWRGREGPGGKKTPKNGG